MQLSMGMQDGGLRYPNLTTRDVLQIGTSNEVLPYIMNASLNLFVELLWLLRAAIFTLA